MNLEAITHLWNYRPRKFRSDAFLFWSRGPDSYRKNDRKRAVVWPWLVLQLSTVLALTQLGIRQSDWRRAGIRSTNLHIVVELILVNFQIRTYELILKRCLVVHCKTHQRWPTEIDLPPGELQAVRYVSWNKHQVTNYHIMMEISRAGGWQQYETWAYQTFVIIVKKQWADFVQMDQSFTHLPLDKMAAILQTIFSDAFLWMKSFGILIKISLKFVP